MMQEQQISITLSVTEWNTVLEGVAELPFRKVAALVSKIQSAANEAIKAAVEAPKEDHETSPTE